MLLKDYRITDSGSADELRFRIGREQGLGINGIVETLIRTGEIVTHEKSRELAVRDGKLAEKWRESGDTKI